MTSLDIKLLRDLRAMRGQAIAIGLVLAVGVLLQVMMSGLVTSLTETRRAYYERNRMADVFASVARAPVGRLALLEDVPGVAQVEGRVAGGALIDLPEQSVPFQGRALSLPDRIGGGLNVIYLEDGRMPAPGTRDEILLLSGFAAAHGLSPGDTIQTTLNGARHRLQITGLADSPEFLYVGVPGELTPNPARFGVIWMRRDAMAAAYDMSGAFNEVLVSLTRQAVLPEVLERIDVILAPWGGTGAYGRADLVSDRFVSEEISGLATMSRSVPPLFLAVAAFLLYIVVGRLIQAEREEIGLLKSFGYSNPEVAAHYFKFVLLIAVGGAVLGCLLGVASGRAMIPVYAKFYNFPFLVFRPDPAAFAIGATASIAAASAGGLLALRQVFALAPAEAMRPPAPPDYSRAVRFGGRLGRRLDQPTRMVLRGISRRPVRTAALVAGVTGGMALSSGMTTIYSSFDRMMDLSFTVVDRSDATVTFIRPLGGKAAFELARIPGVMRVEPVRDVAATLRHGRYSYRSAISGMVAKPDLTRVVSASLAPVDLPSQGVVLGKALADILHIQPGDILTVDVRQGRMPVFEVPVVQVAETMLGAPAFLRLETLNRAMGEPGLISGAHLLVDQTQAVDVYRALKDMPTVAGVSVAEDARRSLQELMDQGAGSARYIMGLIAFIITFGIVYNAARIAQNELSHDLASLRAMGFSSAETGFVLLAELGVIVLIALPLGSFAGHGLSIAIASGFSNDLYQIPAVYDPASHGFAAAFVIGAALISGWLVKRDMDRVDLIMALKTGG